MPAIAASIALAPLENLSGDPSQDVLALGFVEDVASALSRFGTIEVVYPQAFAAFPRRSGSTHTPAASSLLRGSVRRAGEVIRIAVQDQIAEQIASALKIGVDRSRLRAAQRAPLSSLETYDCWLRGFECLKRGTVEADAEARVYFERALEADPSYARAHTGLSLSHFNEWSCQAWHKWDETERLAYDHASRAATLDDGDPMVQVILGRILLYRRRFDEAAFHVDRALSLNPNDTDVLVHAAMCRAYLGDAESALALGTRAMRLHPGFPPYYGAPVGLALFVLGRDAEVLAVGAQAPITMFVDIPAFLAASCALSGDLERARFYLGEFLSGLGDRITYGRPPDPGEPLRWLLHVNPFRRPEDIERLERGLRLAGLEEDPDDRRPEAVARPVPQEPNVARFGREGPIWRLDFNGLSVQLTHQKGFSDLARLLDRPGVEVHCLELADLENAVRTGTFCLYQPERPIDWHF